MPIKTYHWLTSQFTDELMSMRCNFRILTRYIADSVRVFIFTIIAHSSSRKMTKDQFMALSLQFPSIFGVQFQDQMPSWSFTFQPCSMAWHWLVDLATVLLTRLRFARHCMYTSLRQPLLLPPFPWLRIPPGHVTLLPSYILAKLRYVVL